MTRARKDNRLQELVNAATKVFLEKGYRRTQIADVARAMGVAPGTLYLYVAGKEALFGLAIRASLSPDALAGAKSRLPLPAPAPGATVSLIRKTLKKEARIVSLEKALGAERPTTSDEFEAIVRELYQKASQHWLAVKLLERAALDWPELATVWFGTHRLKLLRELERYIRAGVAAKVLRDMPDKAGATRLVLEAVAFFAMHRRVDPHPTSLDEQMAEETVVDAMVHAYVFHKGPPRQRRIKTGGFERCEES